MPNPAIMTMQGLPLRAQIAEAEVMKLAPSYQFRADTVTLSGGNVATIPNRRGADALVMTAGTLAAPATDILFGGAQSLVFSGTQWLDSNLPSSAWKFLHDGTGFEIFSVFSSSSTATQVVCATISSAGPGYQHYTGTNSPSHGVFNAAVANVASSTGPAGQTPNDAAVYTDFYYGSAAQPLAQGFTKAMAAGYAGAFAPSSANPVGPLRLGANLAGAFGASMRFCELLIFPRVLHEYERQIVREYIAARYGIAAPSLTGAHRRIMARLPFLYSTADAYSTNAGKVTAFLDRARPGHVFAQGTTGKQATAPTANAAVNNALAAVFDGTDDFYQSSLPAAAWDFLHKGSQTTYFLWVPASLSGNQAGLSTFTGNAAFYLYASISPSGAQQATAQNNAGVSVASTGAVGTNSVGAAKCTRIQLTPSLLTLHGNGAQLFSGTPGTLGSNSASTSLLIGSLLAAGSNYLNGSYVAALSFNRALSAQELADTSADFQTLFGVAA